jgi:hypothetical protein
VSTAETAQPASLNSPLEHLDALRVAMLGLGFKASIAWPGEGSPYVRVVNPVAGDLAEDVRCVVADDGHWYRWSWDAAIEPVCRLDVAARKIAHVLATIS